MPSRNNLMDDVFWEQHVRQYHQSKLSRAAYCREQGLRYHRFKYYLKKSIKKKKENQLIPITIKPARKEKSTLGMLNFQSGHSLVIHHLSALEFLLERLL
jgi:hypothetical protein